jgi:hypothetical protein
MNKQEKQTKGKPPAPKSKPPKHDQYEPPKLVKFDKLEKLIVSGE